MIKRDSLYIVTVINHFTNGLGKETKKDIYVIVKSAGDTAMKIINSSGMADFSDLDDYKIGIGSGCISSSDTLDQEIVLGMKKAAKIKMDKAVDLYSDLLSGCTVQDWTWESSYGGGASGKGIVMNNTNYSIPHLKYVVTYKNRSGEEITEDDGYVSVDAIGAGESRSFSFYTAYVGGASKASIKLTFDDDLIFQKIASQTWSGKECAEYFDKHPEELKELTVNRQ